MKSETPTSQDVRLLVLPDALRCPLTHKPVELEPCGTWVRVVGEALRYPVRDGIPVLVASAAERSGA